MINREMNKFKNAKIYKICDVGYNKCYIGSTCEDLSQRMARHRHNYSSYQRNKCKFTTSLRLFEEYGLDNYKIELIETFPCENTEELRRREGYVIKKFDCVNKTIAGRADKAYKQDNRDHIVEQKRERYERNREDEINKAKERYQRNKDCTQERIECPVCKCLVRRCWMKQHNQSREHTRKESKLNQRRPKITEPA